MNQSDQEKQNVKNKLEEDRLPVGELKWSEEEEKERAKRASDEETSVTSEAVLEEPVEQEEKEEKESSPPFVNPFATAEEKKQETNEEEQEKKEEQQDPLSNLEDTLTPIHFKEYDLHLENEATSQTPPVVNQPDQGILDTETVTISLDEEEQPKKKERVWARRLVKILWLPVLLIVVFFLSLYIGHSVIGDQPASDIFDIGMWKHLYNLIYG